MLTIPILVPLPLTEAMLHEKEGIHGENILPADPICKIKKSFLKETIES